MDTVQQLKQSLASRNIKGLAIDIDETLSWTIMYWVQKMQELFGNPEGLTPQELIAKYRYTQHVPYWQSNEAIEWMDKHRNSNEIQEVLPLIEGADKAIHKINETCPVVVYLTTRPAIVVPGTKNWLVKHEFPPAEIIARPAEVRAQDGNTWKASVLEELYPQVIGIIDDNPGLADSLSATYEGTVLLYDNSHHARDDIKVVPGKSWDDILSGISAL